MKHSTLVGTKTIEIDDEGKVAVEDSLLVTIAGTGKNAIGPPTSGPISVRHCHSETLTQEGLQSFFQNADASGETSAFCPRSTGITQGYRTPR
ncbi:MAG TPA: hypothetical protein VIK18_08000 [Pirellulales bacterium]